MNPATPSESSAPDARRIDVLMPGELPFWAKALDVTEYDVLFAVDKVGTSAEQVRRSLAQAGSHQHH